MKKNSFRERLQTRYQVKGEEEEKKDQAEESPEENEELEIEDDEDEEKPGDTDLQPGSAHPDNWQTDLQSGKSTEEIRQDAIALSHILQEWQAQALHAQDYYKELSANSDKYLHMFNPILIKGLSREKLEGIADICQKFARLATIV